VAPLQYEFGLDVMALVGARATKYIPPNPSTVATTGVVLVSAVLATFGTMTSYAISLLIIERINTIIGAYSKRF